MATVVIIEDHEVTRVGLDLIFKTSPDLEVVAHASAGEEALRLLTQHQPDAAVVDLALPDMSGFDLIAEIRHRFPTTRVVVVSGNTNAQAFSRARQQGAHGLALKSDSPEHILEVLTAAMDGRAGAETPGVTTLLGPPESGLPRGVTAREMEVLNLIALGKGVADVAEELGISPATVRKHRENLFRKLNVHNVVEALYVSGEVGLVTKR